MNIPDEILLKIFSYLSRTDLLSCSCVCWRWYHLSSDNPLWKKIFSLFPFEHTITSETLAQLVEQTSWKFAFVCSITLWNKKSPHFWNDVDLYLDLQKIMEKRLSLERYPCNGLFHTMLQLKLEPTAISSPLATPKPSKEALTQLQYSLLALTLQYGSGMVLRKLKEVAKVPPVKYFFSQNPHVTSAFLSEISHSSTTFIIKPFPWPPATSTYLDWEKHFVAPVQDAVLMALKYWAKDAGLKDIYEVINCEPVTSLLEKLAREDFWVELTQRNAVSVVARSIHHKAGLEKLQYHTVTIPNLEFILDKDVCPKDAAQRLSCWTFQHLNGLPKMDILHYMSLELAEFSHLPLNKLVLLYYDKLAHTVAAFCTSIATSRKKVAAIHRAIDICTHLKQMRDFLSLKALWSSVGAVMAQPQLSHLSWNDIKFKECERFGELKVLMSNHGCYSNYLRHVKQLQEAYVPYLPAHRQYCRAQKPSLSEHHFTMEKKPSLHVGEEMLAPFSVSTSRYMHMLRKGALLNGLQLHVVGHILQFNF